jgi:hypothetical protein
MGVPHGRDKKGVGLRDSPDELPVPNPRLRTQEPDPSTGYPEAGECQATLGISPLRARPPPASVGQEDDVDFVASCYPVGDRRAHPDLVILMGQDA